MGGYFIDTEKKIKGLRSPDLFPFELDQQLSAVCNKLGIGGLSQFEGQSTDELMAIVDLPDEAAEALGRSSESKWFSPTVGLEFIKKLKAHKRTSRETLWDDVLGELAKFEAFLSACKKAKVRWRLVVDV